MLTVRNWAKFQHYKERRPPWIKLHRDLLDDMPFNRLPLASQALAPKLWLLASESEDGTISDSLEVLAYRLRVTEADLSAALNPLMQAGFIRDDSAALAPCLPVAVPEERRDRVEAEEETETEQSKNGGSESHEGIDEFVREVLGEFYKLRGYELPEISHREYSYLQSWHADGLPVRVVLRGFADCCEQMRKRRDKPGGKPLGYYDSAVREAARMWRKSMVGAA